MPKFDNQPCGVEVPEILGIVDGGTWWAPERNFSVWLTPSALLALPDYGAAEAEGKYMAHMAKYGPFK